MCFRLQVLFPEAHATFSRGQTPARVLKCCSAQPTVLSGSPVHAHFRASCNPAILQRVPAQALVSDAHIFALTRRRSVQRGSECRLAARATAANARVQHSTGNIDPDENDLL